MCELFRKKKIFVYGLLLAILVVIFDQMTKHMALHSIEATILKTNGIHSHIRKTSFLNIVLVWNSGISFGIFNDGNIIISHILLLIVIGISIFIFYNLWKSESLFSVICFSLMLGGAIGNIIDRSIYGAVIDFIDLHIKNLHWPAFNMADASICVGVFLYFMMDFVVVTGRTEQNTFGEKSSEKNMEQT
ncbi:MAG: signal peptidase II [Rickettsiales bacterium]|jgi:signal peptidase II|nr:signal peptidase II [Rickettsiales bacterium]